MLDAKQLEALAAVVEHGGFGPAAKALSLTLAAVSLRIKTLESQLGQRLLVRGKAVRATAAGQALLAHIKQLRSMEADLLAQLPGAQGSGVGRARWHSLAVAINADSLASWFLPGLAALLLKQRLLLDITIDDQDHTHDALRSGDVIGCVTTLAQPMRGCVAEPLGVMRYRCVAAPDVVASSAICMPFSSESASPAIHTAAPAFSTRSRHWGESPAMLPSAHTACKGGEAERDATAATAASQGLLQGGKRACRM